MAEDSVVTTAIASFLKDRGYSASAQLLLEEDAFKRKNTNNATSLKRPRPAEYDLDSFIHSQKQLQQWLISSLDQFRDELWPVSWIMYLHSFITLLEADRNDLAACFRDTFIPHHQHAHSEEVKELTLVTSKLTLQSNTFLQRVRGKKFKLILCKYSLELLVSFLLSENLLFHLSVLNEKVQVCERESLLPPPNQPSCLAKAEAIPIQVTEASAAASIVLGLSAEDVVEINTEIVDWAVPAQMKALSSSTSGKKEQMPAKDEEYCPRTDSDFFSNLNKFIIEPLRQQNTPKQQKQKNKQKLPAWPSIAFHTFFNCHDSLTCVEASPDSALLVAGFDDSRIRLWHQRQVGDKYQLHEEELVSHSGPVYSCSLSRDSRSMLSCSADGFIKLWMYLPSQADTQQAKQWFNVHAFRPRSYATPCPVWDVKFSPVGHYFASASHENVARLWDVEHNGNLRTFEGHLSDVNCLQWHPNVHYLASGSTDKTVRLWDINAGRCVRLLSGHVSPVQSMAFDPSGRYLLSAESSGLVFVWDIAAGKRINVLQGHTGAVWSLSCSTDGKYLATGGADATVRVWDTSHIWGRNKGAHESVVASADSAQPHTGGKDSKLDLVLPHQVVRTFKTKFTTVQHLRFQNERLVLACGNFALPLMHST